MGSWTTGPSVGPKMKQTRTYIPAWEKGDRVIHKPSGLVGTCMEKATLNGELWKVRLDGQTRRVVIHATDLVVYEVKP